MADRLDKVAKNAAGKYYVDNTCIDCDPCRCSAPMLFKRDDENGVSYVCRQPETPEEEQLAQTAIEECPVDAIGDDGDEEE